MASKLSPASKAAGGSFLGGLFGGIGGVVLGFAIGGPLLGHLVFGPQSPTQHTGTALDILLLPLELLESGVALICGLVGAAFGGVLGTLGGSMLGATLSAKNTPDVASPPLQNPFAKEAIPDDTGGDQSDAEPPAGLS